MALYRITTCVWLSADRATYLKLIAFTKLATDWNRLGTSMAPLNIRDPCRSLPSFKTTWWVRHAHAKSGQLTTVTVR